LAWYFFEDLFDTYVEKVVDRIVLCFVNFETGLKDECELTPLVMLMVIK